MAASLDDRTDNEEIKQSLLRLVDVLRMLPSQFSSLMGMRAGGNRSRDESGRYTGGAGVSTEMQGFNKILAGANNVPFVAEFRQGMKEGKAIADGFKDLFSGNKVMQVLQLLDKLGSMFSTKQQPFSVRQIPTPQGFGGTPAGVRGLLAPPPLRQLPPPITVPGTVRSVHPLPPSGPPPRTPPPAPAPPGRPSGGGPGPAAPGGTGRPLPPPVNPARFAWSQLPQTPWRQRLGRGQAPPRPLPRQPAPPVARPAPRGGAVATVPQAGGASGMGNLSSMLDALKNIASILKGGDSGGRSSGSPSGGPQISGTVGGVPMSNPSGRAAQGAKGMIGDVGRMARMLSNANSISPSDALQIVRMVGPLMAV
jgi:hypothetical protein